MREVDDAIVVLNESETLAAVEAVTSIRQRYGDRVAIVPAEAAPRLGQIPGVRIFLPDAGPAEPPPGANESERIGVDAWNARLSFGAKRRTGEGLDWDAPGFEAP